MTGAATACRIPGGIATPRRSCSATAGSICRSRRMACCSWPTRRRRGARPTRRSPTGSRRVIPPTGAPSTGSRRLATIPSAGSIPRRSWAHCRRPFAATTTATAGRPMASRSSSRRGSDALRGRSPRRVGRSGSPALARPEDHPPHTGSAPAQEPRGAPHRDNDYERVSFAPPMGLKRGGRCRRTGRP